MPKVSIVTCSYDRPNLLRGAIESLRAQTDQDWEHLIFDDCSNDPEVKKVLSWAVRDPRVRVWMGRKNVDRPAALWNFMLDRARGRYFSVLDDDNQKLPSFVEAMSRELDRDKEIDVVSCAWRVNRKDSSHDGNSLMNLNTSAERLRTTSTCDGGALLYRREIFERAGYFSEDLRTNEDWDWLRRATHLGAIKNLGEVHATYRIHNERRMSRAVDLGNDTDTARVRARRLSREMPVHVTYPNPRKLTASQRDVCDVIYRGIERIPWVKLRDSADATALLVSPFQLERHEVDGALEGKVRSVSLHMEDPYALSPNLDRVRHMAEQTEAWVCTNDIGTVQAYQKVVGNRVIVCPSLGADVTVPVMNTSPNIDVLLCGYAYPSRKRFVSRLLPMLRGLRVLLVGDGWKGQEGAETLPTQALPEAYRLHWHARTVVCLHRVNGDCQDGPIEPSTLNRGFLEGYCGPRVFMDQTRAHHSFDDGDVIWFDGPGDLAGSLLTYLAQERDPAADRFAAKCRQLYTYQTRLARILNCVRAPRYLAEIP